VPICYLHSLRPHSPFLKGARDDQPCVATRAIDGPPAGCARRSGRRRGRGGSWKRRDATDDENCGADGEGRGGGESGEVRGGEVTRGRWWMRATFAHTS